MLFHQEALVREFNRGDNFDGIESIPRKAKWFNPNWRTALITWFKETAKFGHMCSITVESAIFYMDSYFTKKLQCGEKFSNREYLLVGVVALLVSSKMFSAGPQLRVVRHILAEYFSRNSLLYSYAS